MNGMRKVCKFIALAVAAALFICPADSFATEVSGTGNSEIKVKQAVADENKIKVYVRMAEEPETAEGISYQIGNIPVDSIEVYGINEDRNPMRTLIMLDNSLSIPNGSREPIKAMIAGIIDGHAEKELFRLATFSDKISYLSDKYSDDYTVLKNAAGSIAYVNQETYLTDVLYDVIDELNRDGYMGYTRVVVISDGVDNKQLGVTRDELNLKLKDTPYPIYTIGTLTGQNHEQLENMFALSRLSGSEYGVFESTGTSALVSEFTKDAQMAVFEAIIPSDSKVGGKQSSKLILSGGTQLVFDISMPFQVRGTQAETAAPTAPAPTEAAPTVPATPAPTAATVPETPVETDGAGKISLPIIIAIVAGVLLMVAVIVLALMRRKPKGAIAAPADREEPFHTEMIGSETERLDDGNNGGILPSADQSKKLKYRVTLMDKTEISRTYQCELKTSISLGSGPGNDITVKVGTISKKHCMIMNKNGRFFIQDLNSTNSTFVNGDRISFDTEIFSGTTICLGKTAFTIKFDQV